MLNESRKILMIPKMKSVLNNLNELIEKNNSFPMMSRTHGQPATPTTFNKEINNFYHRLEKELNDYQNTIIYGKMNGAIGNHTAHRFTYPELDWKIISNEFVTKLGINENKYTTQIEPHDYINKLFQSIVRFNNILDDASKDFWGYISFEYLVQQQKENEVGSSTMPHKVNPINFENAEGNLFLSTLILGGIGNFLQTSRFQRDLTDSTVLRNIGIGFGHAYLAYDSFNIGLSKIAVNHNKIQKDLNENWALLAEPIQLMMKKHGIEGAYEELKELTRGKALDQDSIKKFILTLHGRIPQDDYKRLLELRPDTYY